jgi:hypothetical protein
MKTLLSFETSVFTSRHVRNAPKDLNEALVFKDLRIRECVKFDALFRYRAYVEWRILYFCCVLRTKRVIVMW